MQVSDGLHGLFFYALFANNTSFWRLFTSLPQNIDGEALKAVTINLLIIIFWNVKANDLQKWYNEVLRKLYETAPD